MARKIKVPNEQLKRFARQEQKRKLNIRNKRQYYLIVCEGEKTEPNYFEGLKEDLPRGVLTSHQISIQGAGRGTQILIDKALRLKNSYEHDQGRLIDKLWVVFDRDSFDPDDFNNAITRCKNSRPTIGCAWSNEAFELWYLLHFNYYNIHLSRADYPRLLEENFKPLLGNEWRYLKNSKEMYQLLKEHGDIETAVRYGKSLAESFNGRKDYANQNPCTMVWELVEELLSLKS